MVVSGIMSDVFHPESETCIWPGCTRPRAPGRVSGSGRQKEYCLQADPPELGGGPGHNARNRWAVLRGGPASPGSLTAGDEAAGESGDEPGSSAPASETGP